MAAKVLQEERPDRRLGNVLCESLIRCCAVREGLDRKLPHDLDVVDEPLVGSVVPLSDIQRNIGISLAMAGFNVICVRAIANCTKGSVALVSSGAVLAMRWY